MSTLADEDFRRQMQRGLAGFVRAVALEAINLGATVAAGAEVALTGESSASHTSGVKQALRQVRHNWDNGKPLGFIWSCELAC